MIRILAYNVSGALDPAAVTEVLRGLRPDVVCMTEAPPALHLRRMSRRAGLHTSVRAGRRRARVAVLTGERTRVLSQARHELPTPAGIPQRWAAQAILGVGGVRFSVLAVQLGMRPEIRATHGLELERLAASIEAPCIVAGDFNETPGGAVALRFAEFLQDAFAVAGDGRGETYPNPEPTSRRDLIFVSRDLAIRRCWVPSQSPIGVASHHRPVLAEVADVAELGGEADDARSEPAA